MYEYNGKYDECQINSFTCKYNDEFNTLKCLSCLVGYAVIDGECVSCGNFCSICQNYHDLNNNRNYLICIKC